MSESDYAGWRIKGFHERFLHWEGINFPPSSYIFCPNSFGSDFASSTYTYVCRYIFLLKTYIRSKLSVRFFLFTASDQERQRNIQLCESRVENRFRRKYGIQKEIWRISCSLSYFSTSSDLQLGLIQFGILRDSTEEFSVNMIFGTSLTVYKYLLNSKHC